MSGRLESWITAAARASAILGGIVLTALGLMTVISITGRAFLSYGLKPVPGDFELIEAGTAFVVCAFLPWCHLQQGHAVVSVLTDRFGKRPNAVIDLLTDVLLLAAALVITWRHMLGLFDKQAYGETTFILQFPLWWAYASCVFGLAIWIAVALWSLWASVIGVMQGAPRPSGAGALH